MRPAASTSRLEPHRRPDPGACRGPRRQEWPFSSGPRLGAGGGGLHPDRAGDRFALGQADVGNLVGVGRAADLVPEDRKSVVSGKRVSVLGVLGVRRVSKKYNTSLVHVN